MSMDETVRITLPFYIARPHNALYRAW